MENKTLLPLALTYLTRGWSVIICGTDKKPILPWKEFMGRYATPEELVKWFTDFPEAQIGIVCGPISNLTVIDVESTGDLDLIKDQTYTVKSGGGGKHFYFQYDPDFKNAVGLLPKIDIRSTGGFIVASGSTTHKGHYETVLDLDVCKMSFQTKMAFKMANRPQLPWFATSGATSYPGMSADSLDYIGVSEGGRNDAMTKLAGSIHAKLHSSLWQTIGRKMFEEANLKNTPPLPPYEMNVIWTSIGVREVTQNPMGRDYSIGASKEKTWGPSPAPQKFGDSIGDDSDGVSTDTKETLHASEVAGLQVVDSDHTYSLDMPPFDEALLGGFSAGDLVIVAGQSGHGKTTLIQDWSVTLSSGGQSNRDKLPSLWFSYEVLAKPLWQKFQLMGANTETPIYMPRFNETGDTEWVLDVIEKAIIKWGIKVVCIDHLGFLRAPKGNYSNAADAVTHTVRALKRLAIKRGLIILLPVHVRKTSAKTPDLNDIRDSLGIAQEADTVFFIGREKDESGLSTQQAKVWLVKNRKTGIAVSATFDYQFGRYFYNADADKKKPEQDSGSSASYVG
jgi:archaellum biogenesis ATPase FlaH